MKYLLPILLIMLCSCVQINESFYIENKDVSLSPISLEPVLMQNIEFLAKKALYSDRTQVLYVLDDSSKEIFLYKNNRLVNRIKQGSIGKYSIQRIADIALANDGGLWALDYFEKKIVKIDSNGMILTTLTLVDTVNPINFVLLENTGLYVYDKAKNEILVYEPLTMRYVYSFAKMLFEGNISISGNKDRLWIYDDQQNKTYVFSTTGKLLSEQTNKVVYDRFVNALTYENWAIVNKANGVYLPVSGSKKGTIDLNGKHLSLLYDKQIFVYEIKYEKE
ncbi:MAG TPA: hypothetical protein PL063_01545 [Candidatus Cloacimonadota bacterium]|nr:hypothetical protein [Candidatus Cloacimonadales bacterium]HPY95877.1 hypothetical protein [Candidatus Cloacimonadota bacterium]HQB41028.1 hypothetical protein [Candidatus Cloacimonadota bacterium]